ncbi:MAG TPA: PEGA domain-containing protein [Pyrinomonadaceae bacterium]|nr:PEGA domain-containing protein [Pyrinomonadaceae bacterium]
MKSLTRIGALVAVSLICSASIWSQDKTKKDKQAQQTQTPAQATPATPRPPLAFGLSEDTPVKLRLTRTMSSKDAKADEKVDFEVLEDIKVGDAIIVQHGAMAIGTVTEAQPKRRMGRAGKLNINIDYVQLVDGEKVPLRAVKGGSGGSHTGAMTGAIVATSILFFPAAPFFLFMHGKDITIPKGTEITAYIAADTPLSPANFNKQSSTSESGTAKSEAAATGLSSIIVKSTPDGAEISVDDKFLGTTPSTVQLTPGEHKIVIMKAGFKPWERTMTINPNGSVNLDVSLEKAP